MLFTEAEAAAILAGQLTRVVRPWGETRIAATGVHSARISTYDPAFAWLRVTRASRIRVGLWQLDFVRVADPPEPVRRAQGAQW